MAKAGKHERQRWTSAVLSICVLTGFLFVAASVNADGTDLRPSGGDVGSLLQERSDRIADRRAEARKLRSDIDALSASVSGAALDDYRKKVSKLEPETGLTALRGPGVRVTLTDAPRSVDPEGVDPNLLVVHQQDIQAFVNALWSGGADLFAGSTADLDNRHQVRRQHGRPRRRALLAALCHRSDRRHQVDD